MEYASGLLAAEEAVEAVEGRWRTSENSEVRNQNSDCRMTDAAPRHDVASRSKPEGECGELAGEFLVRPVFERLSQRLLPLGVLGNSGSSDGPEYVYTTYSVTSQFAS